MNLLLLINIFLLLIFILGNLFISSHLYENIDDYVLVYNYLKKKSLFYLLLILNRFFLKLLIDFITNLLIKIKKNSRFIIVIINRLSKTVTANVINFIKAKNYVK